MGDSHTLTRKPSKIFSTEREVPHIRIGDESVLDSRYSREKKLGQGTFGIVYQGVNVETKEVVAIKVVNRDKAGSANIKLLEREIGILKTVSHEHIIRLNEVYETQSKIFLIMEFCDRGELSELFRTSKKMEEATVKIILKRLSSAMAYLHINGIVHRDLKMENILVGTNPNDPSDQFFIKITDFGLSVVRGGMGPESMLSSFCGTPAYMAPEIIQNKSYSETCDNWSIGCITFALLTGQLPFFFKEDEKLYEAIKSSEPDWHLLPKNTSSDAKHCLRKLLSKDPASRMTAGELLRHPWITGDAGSATPNVLDLMHDFLQQKIQDDDEDAITEENKEDFTAKSTGSRGSSSNGIRLSVGTDSPAREQSSDSNHNSSRTSSKANTTSPMKKSPSENEFDSSTGSQTGSQTTKKFECSLPASSATKNLFSSTNRNQSAAVSTPRQGAAVKTNSSNSNLALPKPPPHNNSASNLSTKSNGGNGNLTQNVSFSSSQKANNKKT